MKLRCLIRGHRWKYKAKKLGSKKKTQVCVVCEKIREISKK